MSRRLVISSLCPLPSQLVYDKWCKVLDTVPERESALVQETEKQQMNEQLRLAFAEKANALAEYIQQRGTALADLSVQAVGTMEVAYTHLLSLSPSPASPLSLLPPPALCYPFHSSHYLLSNNWKLSPPSRPRLWLSSRRWRQPKRFTSRYRLLSSLTTSMLPPPWR